MDLEEIEDLCYYNLSYGIPIKDTLISIGRSDLIHEFSLHFS